MGPRGHQSVTLWTPPRKSLLRVKSAQMKFIASGFTKTSIVPSSVGAAVGDYIIATAPYDYCIGGVGGTQGSVSNWAYGYNWYYAHKALDTLANMDLGYNSYGACWAIWRGPTKATYITIAVAGGDGSQICDVAAPASLGDTIGIAAFAHDRSGDVATGIAPAGWNPKRLAIAGNGAFSYEIWDQDGAPGARTDRFTNFSAGSGYAQMVAEFELGKT